MKVISYYLAFTVFIISVSTFLNAETDKYKYEYLFSSSELIKKGNKIFKKMCAACHGKKGDGNTPVAMALNPKPRSFTDPDAKWKFSREPHDVYKVITKGSPGTVMVGFEESLTVEERWKLVHFINSLSGSKGQYQPITKDNMNDFVEKF